MFYERPVALNRERHQALRLAPVPGHYRFAAGTNALPIAGSEFGAAARDYPIVFTGQEGGPFNVAALVGLRDDENLMVDDQGQWASGTYVPAFARRYPFVLAKSPGSDRLTVCVDEVYPGLVKTEGEALFDDAGKETPFLQRVLAFLRAFHEEAKRTTDFATRLKELGLLVPKMISVQRKGQPRRAVRGLWTVDVAKLRALDDARVLELYRNGYLPLIEAHLLSLGALPRLISRLDEHTAVSDESGTLSAAAEESTAPDLGAAAAPTKH